MLEVYSLGDYFIKHLKPLGDFFLQPFELPLLLEEMLRLLDGAAYLGNPLAGFIADFFREAQGVPLAWVLFGSGIIFFVVMRFVKFVLGVIPVL